MLDRIPITERGLAKLKEELSDLITVERPQNIKAIAQARAHGDLSENAEYRAAKERQSFLEGGINELEEAITRSEVIEIEKQPKRVVFGVIVEIEHLFNGNISTYQLVGPYESNLDENKISVLSPMGKALIGKEECDIVEVETPNGIQEFEILGVK